MKMNKILMALMLIVMSACQLSPQPKDPSILIIYAGEAMAESADLLRQESGGQRLAMADVTDEQIAAAEHVLLGFESEGGALPLDVREFLADADLGARSVSAFVRGRCDPADILDAISRLQPGALLGSVLQVDDADADQIRAWADELDTDTARPSAYADTAASAEVTPRHSQTLYLWEEGNMPAQTSYTENDGSYFDDPDFRPYLTSYPAPEGTAVKGAVLICPGGAFQFRSDQPEGVDVAQALNELGYTCFVIDYRVRPYTQQEGTLDLARAVRFVRAHAEDYGIEEKDIAVMGFSAGGILCGEMLLHEDGLVNGTVLDPSYVPDALDAVSADAAACGMIYAFYGRLSVGTTDVELLRSGELPPTFYCYGTRDPFYEQFLANADAAQEAGVAVQRLQLEDMPHGYGAEGGWIAAYADWLSEIFAQN